MKAALLGLSLLLGACHAAKPVEIRNVPYEVKVAVPQRVLPPASLTAAYQPERLPEWVPPADPKASSCLTAEDEGVLKEILLHYRAREQSFSAWATAGGRRQ